MTSRHTMQIEINANNPAHYLACCGAFEILSRFDASALSRWETDPVTRFVMESSISEAEIVVAIVKTFSDWNGCWRVCRMDETEEAIRLDAAFCLTDGKRFIISFDWWYETLASNGKIDSKSAWKLYAGRPTALTITELMIETGKELAAVKSLTTIADLFAAHKGLSRRFGFDPHSSRSALNLGYSAYDIKLDVATYYFVELLAMVATQCFFPHRTRQGGGQESTRSFIRHNRKTYYRYNLWSEMLPVILARVVACGSIAIDEPRQMFASEIDNYSRGDYKNLLTAVSTNSKNFKKGTNDD